MLSATRSTFERGSSVALSQSTGTLACGKAMKRSRSDDIEREARKQAAHTRKIPLELSRLRQQMTEEQSRRVSAALAQLGDMVSDTRIVSSSAGSEERGLSRWTVMEAANGDGVRANWVEVNDINVTVVAVAVAMNPQAAESAATGRPSVSAAAAATASSSAAATTTFAEVTNGDVFRSARDVTLESGDCQPFFATLFKRDYSPILGRYDWDTACDHVRVVYQGLMRRLQAYSSSAVKMALARVFDKELVTAQAAALVTTR